MSIPKVIYQNYICYLLFLIIAFLYLLIFSTSTSPLYNQYGGDSAVFLMFGKMFNSGKIPYVDFFDHKGPMMIFIQAFAQKIYLPDARLSTFILQSINLSLILFIYFKTARTLLSPINSLSTCFIALLFFKYTIDDGNLTEEYSLLFTSFCFYQTLKLALNKYKSFGYFTIFLVGLSAAIVFWIRLNNLGLICACTVFVIILLISHKEWKELIRNAAIFLLGFLVITIPLLCYLIANNALSEMIAAAFIHNIKYVGVSTPSNHFLTLSSSILYLFIAWMPFLILTLSTIIYYRKTKNKKIVLLAILLLIFGYITTHVGNIYSHYMTLNLPLLLLGCILFLDLYGKNKKHLSTILVIAASICLISLGCKKLYIRNMVSDKEEQIYVANCREIASAIPLDEQNAVYPYQVLNKFLPIAGLQPCYKYFMMQEWTGLANKNIIREINEMMSSTPPKWVVTQYRAQSTNDEFWTIIDHKYSLYLKNEHFELYHLNR